jgi:hypothetical protein
MPRSLPPTRTEIQATKGVRVTEQTRTGAVFEIVITPRRKPTEALPLDNFDGSGAQFLRFFAGYVNSFPKGRLVQDNTHSFGEPSRVTPAGVTYSCRMVSGTSGIISRFRAREGRPEFSRTGEDVEEMSFGAYLLQPPNARAGFLVIERVGNRTLARGFRTMLVNHFKAVHPNLIVTLTRTAETDAWREAERQGQSVAVRRITVVHRGIETSQMAQFGIASGSRRTVGEYSRILNFKDEPESASVLGRVRRYFHPEHGVAATGGTISTGGEGDDDGGADHSEPDEVNEIIAEISTPARGPHSIRYSGARPPAITYPIDVGAGDDDVYVAFRRSARDIARSLAEATDCRLETGWDTGEWQDADDLPRREVQGFGQVTAAPQQSD